jgi:hypothetical protein
MTEEEAKHKTRVQADGKQSPLTLTDYTALYLRRSLHAGVFFRGMQVVSNSTQLIIPTRIEQVDVSITVYTLILETPGYNLDLLSPGGFLCFTTVIAVNMR